jgi:hypothetical protein
MASALRGESMPGETLAALARLEAIVDAARRVGATYSELLELREAAMVQAKRDGASFGKIAAVLGISRQAASRAYEKATPDA